MFNKLITLLSLLMIPVIAMETEMPTSYEISEECYANLEKIKKDGGMLYYALIESFQEIGKQNRLQFTPSDILNNLCDSKKLDDKIKLQYMPVSQYLTVLKKYFQKFDAAFDEQYQKSKDIKNTWAWFEKYFKEEGILAPLSAFKKDLVEKDAAIVHLRDK